MRDGKAEEAFVSSLSTAFTWLSLRGLAVRVTVGRTLRRMRPDRVVESPLGWRGHRACETNALRIDDSESHRLSPIIQISHPFAVGVNDDVIFRQQRRRLYRFG